MSFELKSLSYTYLSQYRQCPRKFYLSEVLAIPVACPWPLYFGRCVHAGIAAGLIDEETRALSAFEREWDCGITDDFFRDGVVTFTEQIDWSGNDPSDLRALGLAMVRSYMTEIAPSILSPIVGVEMTVRRQVSLPDGGHLPFISHPDLVTEDAIYDFKTASRPWPKKRLKEDLQSTCYMKQIPGHRFLFVIGTKALPVQWQIAEVHRSEAQLDELDSVIIPEFVEGVSAGRFPRRESYLCRWCSYRDIC